MKREEERQHKEALEQATLDREADLKRRFDAQA